MLMPDGFDAAYRARRGSKRRAEHRRRMRRLLENGEAEFTIARTIDELQPALEEGFRLNDLRWEGRPDRSLFATPAGHAFHRAVLPRLAPQNLARILLLRSQGRVVAFQYWLAFRGSMVSNRRAFDPSFSQFSPGMLTMLRVAGRLRRGPDASRVPGRAGAVQARVLRPLRTAPSGPRARRRHARPRTCARRGRNARSAPARAPFRGTAQALRRPPFAGAAPGQEIPLAVSLARFSGVARAQVEVDAREGLARRVADARPVEVARPRLTVAQEPETLRLASGRLG